MISFIKKIMLNKKTKYENIDLKGDSDGKQLA